MSKTYEIDARIRVTTVEPPAAGPTVRLVARYGGITSTYQGATFMAYTLRNDQQVDLAISYVDGDGNPAAVDGNVLWESSDEAVATIENASPDGTTVTLVGQGNGAAQIKATADADLGTGTRELLTLLDVTVVSGEAVAGVIAPAGDPVPKP